MPTIKTIRVSAKQNEGFEIELKLNINDHGAEKVATITEAGNGSTPLEKPIITLADYACNIGRAIAGQSNLNIQDISIQVEGTLGSNGADKAAGAESSKISSDAEEELPFSIVVE